MPELQGGEQIPSLRDYYDQVHLTGKAIAHCLKEHWDSISEPSRVRTSKLADCLSKFLPFRKVKSSLPLFLKPANVTLVHTALDPQKYGPLPGLDGVSAKLYKTFESFFVPVMHHTDSSPLGGGLLYSAWSMGVEINIPKGNLTDSILELRPLTIVNVLLKWISSILLLQLQNVFG